MEGSPDNFYLGFPCHGCKEAIEILIDDGSDRCRFVSEDVLHILCPSCAHKGHYKSNDVQRYQARHSSKN